MHLLVLELKLHRLYLIIKELNVITINLTLFPGGSGIGRRGILSGSIWTTDCGRYHAYSFGLDDDGSIISGRIPKTQSGHRNPINLLNNITNHIISTRDAQVPTAFEELFVDLGDK